MCSIDPEIRNITSCIALGLKVYDSTTYLYLFPGLSIHICCSVVILRLNSETRKLTLTQNPLIIPI